jgi:nucleotide-binding universal stress UspA family protein
MGAYTYNRHPDVTRLDEPSRRVVRLLQDFRARTAAAAREATTVETVGRRRPRVLVLGAHAPHPVRDLFATSVTRAVLRTCPVPLIVGI